MKKKWYSFIYACCFLTTTHAVILIQGDVTSSPYNFSVPLLSTTYNQQNGLFFVGLSAGAGNGNFSLAVANPPAYAGAQQFIPIAQNSFLNSMAIEFLDLSAPPMTTAFLVLSTMGATPFTNNTLISTDQGGIQVTDPADCVLNDAMSMPSAGIVALAASDIAVPATPSPTSTTATNSAVFAAVRDTNATNNFGTGNSGISLTLMQRAATGVILAPTNAANGQVVEDPATNTALLLNSTSAQLKTDSSADVTFSIDEANINQVAAFWDDHLNQLYLGLRINTGSTDGSIGKGVVTVPFNTPANQTGGISLTSIVTDAIFTPPSTLTENFVVFAQTQGTTTVAVTIENIAVMHTSTGLSYLIVNGNAVPDENPTSSFFAFPLIDNPGTPLNGTLANVNAPLVNGVFQTPPTTPADLFNVDNVQAIIGNGPFPLQEDADPINQMTVIGDTVYVAPGGSTNAGVFFSQALFGSDGKIVRWTPWSLRATPQTAFAQISSGQVTTGSVAFFAVDTTTGNLFMVDNETQTFAGVSSWITPQTTQTLNPITNEITQTLSPDLVSQVSNVLVNGCYCVLDLNSSTRGLQNTNQSYALFGGSDIVIFTVTGTTPQAGPPAVVTEDFTLPANFLATQLPQSGPVYLLAYTQQPTQNLDDENLGDINYFFAATQNGLFAFAGPNGQGFDAAVLSTLNMPPFSTGSWQKISSLPGIPVDIQCNGTNLYILMAKPQYNQATVYTIYNIDLEAKTNLSLLFAPENVQYIIAQTGVGIFENVSTFFGMQLIATGQESMITTNQANYERAQMVLATNQGFFVSQANQDPALSLTHALGITTAADQTAAAWTLIATPSPVAYSDVFSIATPVQHTVWTASIDDLYNFKTYDRSSIHQISGNGNATGSAALFTTFQPEPFNSNNPSVATLDPIINFWTDGARRFFTINQFTSPYFKTQIAVFPYNSLALGITAFSPLQNPTLDEIARFFFAQTVGPTGLVCVGTDSGIVALG